MYRWGDLEHTTVVRVADGTAIPARMTNPGYRAVLAWVEQGNAIADFSLSDRRAARMAELAHRRYLEETRGVVVGGVSIKTDRESQALVDQLQRCLVDETVATVKFKTAAGQIVDCDAALATQIRAAIVTHVQACRSNEAEIAGVIAAAASAEALAAIDLAAGWPE